MYYIDIHIFLELFESGNDCIDLYDYNSVYIDFTKSSYKILKHIFWGELKYQLGMSKQPSRMNFS